ncbi:MAG: thioredoxin domain-containing protein [Clostridia bacterium]|jgi:protein-disulfide isomerase|nr:thioredoxin domain-containing protein [Clostridia bacterium]
MKNKKKQSKNSKWIIILLSAILVIALTILFTQISKNNEVVTETENTDAIATNNPYQNLIDDDAFLGNTNAPVTIIEFSDYECPYCQRFHTQTFPSIKKEYIDKGLVKFVYRDFPLSIHQFAQGAAEAAECAGEQDKYYEMQDKLFSSGVDGGIESYKQYAKEIGLNQTKFDSCVDNRDMKEEVLNDFKDGQAQGVTGTPAFLINGEKVIGAQPFEVFKEVIDRKLAEAQ